MGRPQDAFMLFPYAVKAASYGTAVADGSITDWPKLISPGLVQQSQPEDLDQDEITGHPYTSSSGAFVTQKRTRANIEFKAGVDFLTFLLVSLFGNVSTSGAGDFSHVIKWPGLGVDAPIDFSVIQATNRNVAANEFKYNGVFVNQIEININEPGPILCTAELLGDGSAAVVAVSNPAIDAATEGLKLKYEQMTVKLGPIGTEDVTNLFRSATIRANANVVMMPRPDKGQNVAEIHYGAQEPILEIELVFKGERGDTLYNYWANRTAIKLDLLISIGATQQIRFQMNSARVPGELDEIEVFDDIDHRLTLPIRGEFNATDKSPFIITGKNTIAAYLA